ncbi:MAG: hypothetical protein KJ941_03265 [Bacteroidetes bacterium]|nr:hypothetical protein [Bacteroidota bacterium]
MSIFKLHTFDTIDILKWNQLIERSTDYAAFASYECLQLSCSSCYFLVNEDYQSGIFLPMKKVLGVEIIYTPTVVPFSTFFGENELSLEEIMGHLPHVQQWLFLYRGKHQALNSTVKYFQIKDFSKKQSQQAQRKIKLAIKNDLKVDKTADYKDSLGFLKKELSGKDKAFDANYFVTFQNLCRLWAEKDELLHIQVFDKKILRATLYFCKSNGWMYYLKGISDKEGYNQGAMYFGMNEAIAEAEKTGLKFDFGGSSIKGLRQFFKSFGAAENTFYEVSISKGPWWFPVLRRIRSVLKH